MVGTEAINLSAFISICGASDNRGDGRDGKKNPSGLVTCLLYSFCLKIAMIQSSRETLIVQFSLNMF